MANRFMQQFAKTPDAEMVYLDGYVNTDSDGYTVLSCTIPHVSAAFTSTGKYTLTLEDAYPSCKSVQITPVLTAGVADISHCVLSCDVSSAKTVVIQFHTAGTPANVGVGNGFYVRLSLKNSSLPTGS